MDALRKAEAAILNPTPSFRGFRHSHPIVVDTKIQQLNGLDKPFTGEGQ